MYKRYFSLDESPFSIAPDPRYLFLSKQHQEALGHLVYGVGGDGGFILLTGEVGTGKTTVCRCFLQKLPPNTDVALILNPKLSGTELLETICDELGVTVARGHSTSTAADAGTKVYVDALNSHLLKAHAQGRHTVVIIDEAQNLAPDILEQLRLLTNLETSEKKLLQIVLLGQPELNELFERRELRQLAQRITARFYLDALEPREIEQYVVHRLSIAGCAMPHTIFPKGTLKLLYEKTQGIPRLINIMCDRAMLGAYVQGAAVVSKATLRKAIKEVYGESRRSQKKYKRLRSFSPASVFVGLVFGFVLMVSLSIFDPDHRASVAKFANWLSAGRLSPEPVTDQVFTDEPGLTVSAPSQSVGAGMPGDSARALARVSNVQADALHQDKNASGSEIAVSLGDEESRLLSEALAFQELFAIWDYAYGVDTQQNPCLYAMSRDLGCYESIGFMEDLIAFDRPAVLKLYEDGERGFHVLLKRLDHQFAHLNVNGEEQVVSVASLEKQWKGEYTIIWRHPPTYVGDIVPGTVGPVVKWLSTKLDEMRGDAAYGTGQNYFDEGMVKKVKQLQMSLGLKPDGVVGSDTFIHINNRTSGESVPRLQAKRNS